MGRALLRHVDKAARNGRDALFTVLNDDQRADAESGDIRHMIRQNADVALRGAHDDAVYIALEKAMVDRHHLERKGSHIMPPS